jgi:hypothetical protein
MAGSDVRGEIAYEDMCWHWASLAAELYSSTSQYEKEQEASLWTVAQGQPESLKRRKAPATASP